MMQILNLLLLAILAHATSLEQSLQRLDQSLTRLQENRQRVCLESHTRSGRRLPAIRKGDCKEVIARIRAGDKVSAKMHFSRDETRGFQLPHIIKHETCMVGMDFPIQPSVAMTPDMDDDSSFEDLAKIVEAIVDMCVDTPLNGVVGFGGKVKFGDAGRMTVVVQGTVPLSDDRGRDYYRTTASPIRTRPVQAARSPARQDNVIPAGTPVILDMQMQGHLDELHKIMRGMSRQYVPSSVLLDMDPPPPSGLHGTGSSKRSIINL